VLHRTPLHSNQENVSLDPDRHPFIIPRLSEGAVESVSEEECSMTQFRPFPALALAATLLAVTPGCSRHPGTGGPLRYPPALAKTTADTIAGVTVPDPYRWMEDVDSEEVREWIDAENALTDAWLAAIPGRTALRARLEELWNFERYSIPFKAGRHFFWFHNTGLQPQSVLFTAESPADPGRVLIDPNTLSEDGTVAISGVEPSWRGDLLAWATSEAGSDWQTWHVRRVSSGEDLPDTLHWSKFSGAAWAPDDSGFYYARYDAPREGAALKETTRFQKLFFHRLGTSQAEDRLVFESREHPDWGFSPVVTEDGRWLVIHVSRGTDPANLLLVADLSRPGAPPRTLTPEFEAQYGYVGNDGTVFYLHSNQPDHGRIVAIDLEHPEPASWREIVPPGEIILRGASLFGDTLVCAGLRDAMSVVTLHDLNGRSQGEVPLPGPGSVAGFSGRRSDRETFYSFRSFSTPSTIHRFDLTTRRSAPFRRPELRFDPSSYVTEQVFYTSKDGTRIPMFVSHRKDLNRSSGPSPTVLYGYGGFDISLTPFFSVPNLVWMERGGVLAVPNLRGGGEYGEAWHRAGMLENKQNVFDDFIAAAEWLIASGTTTIDRLAISGASNGGLLVGAVMNQRPDLFAAALPAVGVMDMLRYPEFTIGWAWIPEYGDPNDPTMFRVLSRYSPYHNITPGICYPATLITTADHDDRVFPAHSFKYAARLQAAQGCDRPILIRIETRAGHGAGKPVSKRIDEAADRLAFLVKTLGMESP